MRQLMGNELTRRGNSAAAIEQYREAIKIDPHLPGVHFQLAETLKASPSAADQAAAEAEYERALAENPTDVRSICRLSEYALGRSDFKGALARYIRAVELQPRDEEANLGVARVLMQTGQSPKAEPFLLRAAEADPTDPVVHMRLATVYRESGRGEAAARELSDFRKLKDMKDRLRSVYGHMNMRLPGQDHQTRGHSHVGEMGMVSLPVDPPIDSRCSRFRRRWLAGHLRGLRHLPQSALPEQSRWHL